MNYAIEFTPEAQADLAALDGSQIVSVRKVLDRVSQNPLPDSEGGYGKPLGNKHSANLTGLFKIKLLKLGIRIVYALVREDTTMKVIVIAARTDNEVYEIAAKRNKESASHQSLTSKLSSAQAKADKYNSEKAPAGKRTRRER